LIQCDYKKQAYLNYDITNTVDQVNGKEIEWIEKLLKTPKILGNIVFGVFYVHT
jgi:hypothetical protein